MLHLILSQLALIIQTFLSKLQLKILTLNKKNKGMIQVEVDQGKAEYKNRLISILPRNPLQERM